MTKLALQKELLEKVKPGMKPSDIKKASKNQVQKPVSPPPIEIKDEGYESDKSDKSAPIAPALPKNNFANHYTSSPSEVYKSQTDQKLLDQITSLKKQLQVYQDFKDADLKIKEKLKEENNSLKKTIANLKNTAKPPANTKESQTPKTFLLKNYSCQICFEDKKIPSQLLRVKGLGGERSKKIWVCFLCRKKVVIIHDEEENWRNF